MASPSDTISMALFCDFENVALGVRDAQYEKFDIKPILERLLLKGNIVVKKAYCDWDRYKGFKAAMHEANFELIEIPHVRQSGKNSADIRLVVDALDLCYTKSHVNTFVIISGDSDFSPLVSKLRENAKQVIGVGVKQSTSDLLIANCDEFIFYDDLVRESQRALARRQSPGNNNPPAPRRSAEEERHRRETQDTRRLQGVELAVETFEALVSERGDTGKIWASVLKEAIKRRKPDFSESYYGFRTFGNLLEDAQERGLLEFGRDDKSGAYVFRRHGAAAPAVAATPDAAGRVDASAERQASPERQGGGYFRHDFHAVAQAPDAPSGDRDGGARGGRSRGRQGGASARSAENSARPDLRDSVPPEDRAEWGAGGQWDAPQEERPTTTSYFRQQAPAPVPAVAQVSLADVEQATISGDGAADVSQTNETTEGADAVVAEGKLAEAADDTAAAAPRARSRRQAPAARKSAGRSAPARDRETDETAVSVAPVAADPSSSPDVAATPPVTSATPAKAVAPRTRKPRSGTKSAE